VVDEKTLQPVELPLHQPDIVINIYRRIVSVQPIELISILFSQYFRLLEVFVDLLE
jgi:hypothetical protein